MPEAVEASLQLGGIMLGATGGGNAGPIIEQLRRDGYAGLESIADA